MVELPQTNRHKRRAKMPKLVKCEIAGENYRYDIFKCPGCFKNLKDNPGLTRRGATTVGLCPACHCFFDTNGVIPFDRAAGMFPEDAEYDY
jgi:hypothetical protein